MSPTQDDSEEALENETLRLLEDLGFTTANLYHETFGANAYHGRDASSEVVLSTRLKSGLEKLNPDLPPEAISQAMDEIRRDRSAMNPVGANRELHESIKNGVSVTWKNEDGETCEDRVRVIDFENPSNNDLFAGQQLWVSGDVYHKRFDIVVFINGIPLVFIELKKPAISVRAAYDDNLKDYRNNTVPQFWWYNAFIILSNGLKSKMGSITSQWEHFVDWKKISSEGEKGIISLETILRGTCDPSRLLDLIENFVLFSEGKGGTAKIVAKNHQFLGVRNAVQAVREIKENQGRLGVFWHTQGSGKSFSMVFFCQYVMRRVPGNWTFVVITDRKELDGQIYKTFAQTGLVTEKNAQAESSEELRNLLKEDHQFVFTLIQKFQTQDGSLYPELSDRSDIIVITDEAHRSQYDTLAQNMRRAMPNAAFIGFTGTPLIAGEEQTKNVFGDYVSIYNFKQSIEDGATVPLYYENRIPELQLTNENLNEDMEALLEKAELDEDQEKKLERTFAREYHLITRDERLDTIATDLVDHFIGRGNLGKGMMVCIDRFTAVRMYNKVKLAWKAKLEVLKKGEQTEESKSLIAYMGETDFAVVVSSSQNEQSDFVDKGLDILSHRTRMVKEDLEKNFKDDENPLRLVFVCAMWITGFDVPSCNAIYLDKPMKNHTLMQTITRANRVYEGKHSGLIVDYVGIFRNLQKALALYGSASGGGIKDGETPVEEKAELVKLLKKQVRDIVGLAKEKNVDLRDVEKTRGFPRLSKIKDAVENLIHPDEDRKEFIRQANLVVRLHRALMPDKVAHDYDGIRSVISTIASNLKTDPKDVDISDIMKQVEALLDESVAPESYLVGEKGPNALVSLGDIDFEALGELFKATPNKKTMLEKLRQAVEKQLGEMVTKNRSRMDFLKKFEEMIEDYNNGSKNIEEMFEELKEFVKELNDEERRAMKEGLSEEELTLFDILTKPEMEMAEKEKSEVKKVAKELLDKLKQEKLVLDWRKRQQSRADVRLTIETILDELPRVYTPDVWDKKCDRVYQHVFDSYYGDGGSLYEEAS